ncbi:MAG: hypothetical protein E7667_00640 [Ruminococcaceae bacterium]|nr:hypothetical protein [Oscillospiraceae bacterium]
MTAIKKAFLLIGVLVLFFALVACKKESSVDTSTDSSTQSPTDAPTTSPGYTQPIECTHSSLSYTTISPDCVNEGYTLNKCKDCDYSYKSSITPPTGHKCQKEEVAATCVVQGYTIYTCECGYTYNSDITPPTGHKYDAVDTPPSCVSQGFTTYTCACGDNYVSNYVKPLGHSYVQSVTAPTCENQGFTTYTCDCGDTYISDYVSPIGHIYSKEIIQPTCTTQGYTVYTCKCGDTYVSDIVSALGHTYSQNKVEPTCTEEGYTEYICTCGDSYISDITSALGHTYSQNKVEPTCTEKGYTEYICTCGDSYISDITSALGHAYSKNKVEPTCTEVGYTEYICTCGDSYISDITSALGHAYSQNKVEPTCTEVGYTEYICTCGDSYISDYVLASGHSFYVEKRVYATISQTGYTDFACSCGEKYRGDYVFYTDIINGAYSGNTQILAKGIDVSKWQHDMDTSGAYLPLDWNAIKGEGVEYAILKAGSTKGIDPVFEMNYAGAREAGLNLGVYYYTYATTVEEVEADARNLLSYLNGKSFEYPVYFDLEDPSQVNLDKELLMQICIRFFEIMQEHGYYVALYTNNNWLNNVLDTKFVLENFDVWYARYPNSLEGYSFSSAELPEWNTELYGENLGMWQFTSSGVLEAIPNHNVDMNVSYKDYPSIIKSFGLNGYVKEI